MKNLFIFILSFFACLSGFAQDPEKRYFENNPELGGDVLIKSSSFKTEKDEIHKTFEIESSAAGAYYYEASYNLSKGNQTLVINASNFKKGVYIVQITIGGESISQTISI